MSEDDFKCIDGGYSYRDESHSDADDKITCIFIVEISNLMAFCLENKRSIISLLAEKFCLTRTKFSWDFECYIQSFKGDIADDELLQLFNDNISYHPNFKENKRETILNYINFFIDYYFNFLHEHKEENMLLYRHWFEAIINCIFKCPSIITDLPYKILYDIVREGILEIGTTAEKPYICMAYILDESDEIIIPPEKILEICFSMFSIGNYISGSLLSAIAIRNDTKHQLTEQFSIASVIQLVKPYIFPDSIEVFEAYFKEFDPYNPESYSQKVSYISLIQETSLMMVLEYFLVNIKEKELIPKIIINDLFFLNMMLESIAFDIKTQYSQAICNAIISMDLHVIIPIEERIILHVIICKMVKIFEKNDLVLKLKTGDWLISNFKKMRLSIGSDYDDDISIIKDELIEFCEAIDVKSFIQTNPDLDSIIKNIYSFTL